MSSDTTHGASKEVSGNDVSGAPVPGALLTDAQIAFLRRAVIVMTTLLVAGVVLLIGRVIYLARGTGGQAASAGLVNPAVQLPLLPDVRLALPAGAEIKQMSLAGSRLAISHVQPGGGETITLLDLATGAVVSRVTIERSK
jgi:Family of unknown function (DUF6476)